MKQSREGENTEIERNQREMEGMKDEERKAGTKGRKKVERGVRRNIREDKGQGKH